MPISQPPSVPPPAIIILETIGKRADLRHASPAELAQILTQMRASEAFKQAAATGDSDHLKSELGPRFNGVVRVNDNPHTGLWDPGDE